MANHGAAALAIIASLLVAVTLVDARLTAHHGYVVVEDVKAPAALTCNKVHGVQTSETCFSVSQSSGLTQDQFLAFNPNINCEKVFVGQWVCLDAAAA
uniref:LysM domain-containing protein n=1 Tax=Oryza punctata TaxID=4537 RepID=A0A0E0JPK9_ORYPU